VTPTIGQARSRTGRPDAYEARATQPAHGVGPTHAPRPRFAHLPSNSARAGNDQQRELCGAGLVALRRPGLTRTPDDRDRAYGASWACTGCPAVTWRGGPSSRWRS
jgi:hypothetical protein